MHPPFGSPSQTIPSLFDRGPSSPNNTFIKPVLPLFSTRLSRFPAQHGRHGEEASNCTRRRREGLTPPLFCIGTQGGPCSYYTAYFFPRRAWVTQVNMTDEATAVVLPQPRSGDGIFDGRRAALVEEQKKRELEKRSGDALGLLNMTGGATNNQQIEEAVAGLDMEKIKQSLLDDFIAKLKGQRELQTCPDYPV